MPAEPFLRFTLADPDREFRRVRLYQELQRPYDGPPFAYHRQLGGWRVELATRQAWRVEYLFNVQHADGSWSMYPDLGNDVRAPGPFGDKSVYELPGYRPPAWVAGAGPTAPAGDLEPIEVPSRRLGHDVPVVLWTPPGHDPSDRLPLLVALDGPELADYAGLLTLLARARPAHVALMHPVARSEEYSASAAFARALATEVIPAIADVRNVPDKGAGRAGLGVSLAAAAMLHAHRTHPELFGALLLQSGSFFQRRTDPQEASFARWARLIRFVGSVLRGDGDAEPIPVTLTCGTVEENLANNRAMRDALAGQGYDVTWVENNDGHNWVSWRDVLDPHLPLMLDGLEA